MFHWLLTRRADRLAAFLSRHLRTPGEPDRLRVLDVGSGTGHNALALAAGGLDVAEVDVADLHVVGDGPRLFDGERLPYDDDAFDVALLLFVLHYPAAPDRLLCEALRVAGRVLVMQSTCRGGAGWSLLAVREWCSGRGGFQVARAAGYVAGCGESLRPTRYYSREMLARLFEAAGGRVVAEWPWDSQFGVVRRDLYLLERISNERTGCDHAVGHHPGL